MGSLTRKLLTVGAVAGSSVLPIVATATPASAAPSNCYVQMANNRDGYSVCWGGTGQHRVIMYCKNLTWWGGTTQIGPWRGVGQQSWSSCPWGTVINSIYYGVQ